MGRLVALIAPVLLTLQLCGCTTSALTEAPDRPDAPWTPVTNPDGEIVAGDRAPAGQPANRNYVLPQNHNLAGVPQSAAGLERRRPYSLPELIDIAESSNPVTRNAWTDARNAALAAGIVQSTFLPIVSAGIVAGYQDSHGVTSALGSNDLKLNGNIAVLSAQWLLFDFGERAALLDVARQGSIISNIAFTAAHQQLIYNVSLAFYANAAARARLASSAEALRDAQKVNAAAESRYKNGLGTVVEVSQTRQASAEARLARVQAEGAGQNAYLALISAMGISPMTRLVVADVSRRKLSPTMIAPIERITAEALARRTDVLTGYAARQASIASLRAAQAEFFPKVFASANGTRLQGDLNITAVPGTDQQSPIVNLPGNSFGNSQTQYGATALIGATVPLYDGGMRAARVEQARDTVDKANTSLTQITNEAVRQIIVARNTLTTSISAYSAAVALAAAAQISFDAALAAYRNGVGSISDATTAERQLLAAKNAATDAYSTALSAAATLGLATGLLGSAPGRSP
jgi:outer membrane protein